MLRGFAQRVAALMGGAHRLVTGQGAPPLAALGIEEIHEPGPDASSDAGTAAEEHPVLFFHTASLLGQNRERPERHAAHEGSRVQGAYRQAVKVTPIRRCTSWSGRTPSPSRCRAATASAAAMAPER